MRAGVLCIAALAFLLPAAAAGPPADRARSLLWPLPGPAPILSSFGEYRYDHLHAGIDLSTGGATGLKVLAADGGEIYRLKVEWRGYGRAAYLRHPGGRVTVYGHLEKFEDAVLGLEGRVARRQAEAKSRYPGDIYLDPPLPVRRGQVIAYSGESGVGLPHLHFEVRERDDHPIDPFVAGLVKPVDHQPPVLEALVVTAAGAGTFIDGTLRERRYALERHAGIYRPVEPVRASGPFFASLEAFDPAGASGRSGLHTVEAMLDGSLIYRLVFRDFRFDQFPESGLVYDHRRSHLGPARFAYRLFRLPGNDLAPSLASAHPFEPSDGPPGAIRLGPGRHALRITARDEAGNRSQARVCLLLGDPLPPAILPSAPADEPGMIRFALEGSGIISPLGPAPVTRLGAGSAGSLDGCPEAPHVVVQGELWDGTRFVPVSCRAERGSCEARDGRARGATIVARLRQIREGVPSAWRIVGSAGEAPWPSLEGSAALQAWPSFLDLVVPLQRPHEPELAVRDPAAGRRLGRFAYRDGLEAAAAVDYHALGSSSRLELVPEGQDAPVLAALPVISRYLGPGEAENLSTSGMRVDVQAGSRFFPGPLLARPVSVPEIPGLPAMSRAVDLLPEGEALNAWATLGFDVQSVPESELRRLGIYRWDPVAVRWSFEGGEFDAGARAIVVRFRRYGRFMLLKDDSPPVVSEVSPADGAKAIDPHAPLLARIAEVGVGLSYDGVAFVLDGSPLETEFDPDRDTARPFEPPALRPGTHRLSVVATDRAGNASAPVSVTFEVR